MAERASRPLILANMAVLISFGWLAILISLTPVDARASAAPTPDLLFCVAAFLAIRRPRATPAALILILGLARDLASGGPVGLGALALWGGVEFLRFRRDRLIRSFVAEAGAVAFAIVAMTAAQLALLLLALTPSPPLEVLGIGALATFAAYFGVALIFRHIFRIRPETEENLKLSDRAGRGR
ncbi:hypothetical protein [Pikeienuella sp. HZG-20]|uniref:hypothetical protein n=1 Tax=Paludibacillus litoralis TaxID=3133267 RepID=UPI0030EB25B8